MDRKTAYLLGRAFAFGNCIGSGMAMDGERWITIHPWGKGKNADYQRVKIDDDSGKIVGGMGFKFQGKTLKEAFSKEKKTAETPLKITKDDLKKENYNEQSKSVNPLHQMLKAMLNRMVNKGGFDEKRISDVAKQIDDVVNGKKIELEWKKTDDGYDCGNGIIVKKDKDGDHTIYMNGFRMNYPGLVARSPELSKMLAEDFFKNLQDSSIKTFQQAAGTTWNRSSEFQRGLQKAKEEEKKKKFDALKAKLEPRTRKEYEDTQKRFGMKIDYSNYQNTLSEKFEHGDTWENANRRLTNVLKETLSKPLPGGAVLRYFNMGNKEYIRPTDGNWGDNGWREVFEPSTLKGREKEIYTSGRKEFDKNLGKLKETFENRHILDRYVPQSTADYDNARKERMAEQDKKVTALSNLSKPLDFKRGRFVSLSGSYVDGVLDSATGMGIYKDYNTYKVVTPHSSEAGLTGFATLKDAKQAAQGYADLFKGRKSMSEIPVTEKMEFRQVLRRLTGQ